MGLDLFVADKTTDMQTLPLCKVARTVYTCWANCTGFLELLQPTFLVFLSEVRHGLSGPASMFYNTSLIHSWGQLLDAEIHSLGLSSNFLFIVKCAQSHALPPREASFGLHAFKYHQHSQDGDLSQIPALNIDA